MQRRLGVFAFALASVAALAAGQSPTTNVRLTLTEGTSMAAALSPDGRTIAIDLLGAVWTLSVEGGPATRILEDGYDARMPTWSPDGQKIAFQAYRSSTWNLWTVHRDGSALRQETSGPFDDREPHWSPDGTALAFASDRSGNYDVWTLTLATGEVRQITTNPANDFMPAWSPDGRRIAFVSDRRERGIYAVEVDSGAERLVRGEAATAAGPLWSPDGTTVAYVSIDGPTARLVVGGNNVAESNEDVFPFRASWHSASGAGGALLYTSDGKLKVRPAAGGPARIVEFSADVAFTRATDPPGRREPPGESSRLVRGIMHPVVSPGGTEVAFAALGDLWIAAVNVGQRQVTPRRITNDVFVETDPAWSPDGRYLAFSSDRHGTMDLWIRDVAAGNDRRLAANAMAAAWSPDGNRIAFLDPQSQLQVVDVSSGNVRRLHDRLNEPGRPSWAPDGRFIVMAALRPYSSRFREGTNQVLRVSVDGAADRWFDPVPHKSIGMREDFGPAWSPDGTQMAAIVDGHLAAFPVARDGAPLGPPRRLSVELANTPSWTADSRRLLYQTADGFRLVDVATGAVEAIEPRLTWTPPTRSGTTTIHAGRLFDGRGTTAQENIDIVVEGNRIARVEPHRAELHTGTVVDASDQTVLPGLIESHAHLSKGYGEALGRIWLSFGITSVRNPAANAYEGQEDREAIDSGARIGPRVFTTGEPFDGTRIYYPGGAALDGGTQLTEQLARAQQLNFDLIKTYVRLPDLLQKRAIEEAHRLGLSVTSHEIYPAVAYGADGVEHIRGTSRRGYSPKMSELRRSYKDVVDLLAASKMTLTPTIGIQGGYQVLGASDTTWANDERLKQMFPAPVIDGVRAMRKQAANADEIARRAALVAPQEALVTRIVKAGGRVIAGTDAPINPYGLTLLLELEHFTRGGLSPAEAIRTATAVPAVAMGRGTELGSIEPGKLADIVIVDGNPLVHIADIRRTRRVMKDGVLHEVDELLRRPVVQPSSPR